MIYGHSWSDGALGRYVIFLGVSFHAGTLVCFFLHWDFDEYTLNCYGFTATKRQ